MYTYANYKAVRDTAWELLISAGISELPVKISQITKSLGVTLMGYENEESRDIFEFCNLPPKLLDADTFSLYTDKWRVFYNDQCEQNTIRYHIARQIGHIVLRHESTLHKVKWFNAYYFAESELNADQMLAAKSFAPILLSPACVLWKLGVTEAEAIEILCGLPPEQAQERAERMVTLIKRDSFLKHDLEKKIYKQFEKYLNNQGE